MLQILVQEAGLKAIANLEDAFKECDRVVETQDKQAIPAVQQNALSYVGQIEEAMVKGFPFEVPSQYDNLPQLKVCLHFSGLHKSAFRAAHEIDYRLNACFASQIVVCCQDATASPFPPLKFPPYIVSKPNNLTVSFPRV